MLSDSDDGKWLREHCDFFIVPFTDKDGVEDGDQGKNRKPHDHNRDYIKRIYPEIQAITEQTPVWLNGKPLFWLDIHCPGLRGDYIHFTHDCFTEDLWNTQQKFTKILEAEKKGPLPYNAARTLPFTSTSNLAAPGFQKCGNWGGSLPNVIFASSLEIPYANASGAVVDADSARALGRDLMRAIRVFWETQKHEVSTIADIRLTRPSEYVLMGMQFSVTYPLTHRSTG